MLEAGPPPLHYYLAVVLHSVIVLPPVGHSPNHQYHCCQLDNGALHVASGPPHLHYYRAVVLHSRTVLPPVGHSPNNQYHCCQLDNRALHVASGAAIFKLLLRRRATFPHRTATCRPLSKPSLSLLSTRQLALHVASGAATFTLLLRRRVTFPHCTATCQPLSKPSVSLLTTRQSSIARCKRGRHLYTTTAPSCYIPAPYCHLSATLQTIIITAVN